MRLSFFLIAGTILFVSGFFYDIFFSGLPYPDPTPALQERWLFHKNVAQKIILVGVAFFCVGGVLKVVQWIILLFKKLYSD